MPSWIRPSPTTDAPSALSKTNLCAASYLESAKARTTDCRHRHEDPETLTELRAR